MHDHLRAVIVAPMTTKSRAAPFRIPLTHAGQRGLVLLDQIRAVDKTRLVRRLGNVSTNSFVQTLARLREAFAD
jgi:mRNA interferase MazF